VGDTSGFTKVRLFAGPKAMDVLAPSTQLGADGKPTGQSLQPLIQFGWMTIWPSRSTGFCASSTSMAFPTGAGTSSLSPSSSTC
jgi:hypothetical protein